MFWRFKIQYYRLWLASADGVPNSKSTFWSKSNLNFGAKKIDLVKSDTQKRVRHTLQINIFVSRSTQNFSWGNVSSTQEIMWDKTCAITRQLQMHGTLKLFAGPQSTSMSTYWIIYLFDLFHKTTVWRPITKKSKNTQSWWKFISSNLT